MKAKHILYIFLLFSLIIVQSVSAVNYDTPTVKIFPDKSSYAPGESVTITADVKLVASGGETFPNDNTLKAYTALEDPSWTYIIKINDHGEEAESVKNPLNIDGWQINYPSTDNKIVVSYSLSAKVPDVASTGDKVFFEIYQTDGSGETLTSGAADPVMRKVLNPEDVNTLRDVLENDLENFGEQIASKMNTGVDVSAAQANYNDAKELIDDSRTASYDEANELLTEAETLINEGETLLNQAWAQKAINEAEATIDATNFYVTDFKVNRSMTNDARVINIETKLESAQSSLNSAKSLFNDGSYTQAYTLAETANSKAKEALTYAEEIYAEVSKGLIPDFGPYTFIFIGVIIVILAVVGYVVYNRYSSWDELG